MIWFNLFRRRARATPALWIAAVIAGAALSAGGPAAAQETAANPNVIVDESVLDSADSGTTLDAGLLPAPDRPPVSRLVTTDSGASTSGLVFPPETTSDTTFSAVPTAPIQSFSLDPEPTEEVMSAEPSGGMDMAAAEAAPTEDSAEAAAAEDVTAETEAAALEETDAGEQQTAARPPIDGMVRVPFDPEAATIPDPAKSELDALVERLNGDYLLRLQVLAYAGGDEDESSHARGVSLARALAMRDYLSGQGVDLERMDIRALGNTAQEEPADRVDLIPLAQ